MTEKIEMATVSSRGQVCIPTEIREELKLEEGSKVVFILKDDSVLMKKVTEKTFEEITAPLKEAIKRSGLKESEVVDIIHRFRSKKHESNA